MSQEVAIPSLIGVDGIARLLEVPPNTVYSWSDRGQLGRADVKLSRRSMWYRDRLPEAITPEQLEAVDSRYRRELFDKGARPPYPAVLLGPAELATAFGVQPRTHEAWRRRGRARDLPATDPARPPAPVFVVSLTPIWVAADWRPYAEATGKTYRPPTLAAWRKQQRQAT